MSNVVPFQPRTVAEGQLPPHDLEAEIAVLSSVMLTNARNDPSAQMASVADFLQPEHFFSEAHRRIYEAALELHGEGKAHDIVTVGGRLQDRKRIGQVGGMAYLTEILGAAPAIQNLREYATIVFEKWRARQLIATAQKVVALGYQGTTDVQAYADDATAWLGAIARRSVGVKGQTNGDTLRLIIDELRARGEAANGEDGALGGFSYGLPALDRQTGGMHSREMIMLIAGAGVGKTTASMGIALHTARRGIGVQVFGTETSRREWFESAISALGHVDNAIWSGARMATIPEWGRIMAASEELASWKHLLFDETKAPDMAYVANVCAARALTAVKVDGAPLGLVVIDYLQKLSPRQEGMKKHEAIDENALAAKSLADRLRIPVLVVAQQRDNPFDKFTRLRARPETGMVGECRTAERHADKVFYLHRAPLMSAKGKEYGESKTKILLVTTKGRKAANDDVELVLNGPQCRFVDGVGQTQDRFDPLMAHSRTMVDHGDDDSERRYP